MADRLSRWIGTVAVAAMLNAFCSGDVLAGRFLDWCSGRGRQTTQQQVLYVPIASAGATPVVAGYVGTAAPVTQPTVAYSFPTGTYPPYPTSPAPLYSQPRYQAPAPTTPTSGPVFAVPAATAPSLSMPPAGTSATAPALSAPTAVPSAPGPATPSQTVAYPYTPRVTYRTVWAAVPVTSYRPTSSATGTQLRPCNRLRWQARRVPQTTFRPIYAYAPPPPTTAYSIPSPTTAYSLPTTAPSIPLMNTVQPATGAIGDATTYDSYGATTGWSGYPNGTAFSPPVAPASSAPATAPMAAGATTVPSANYAPQASATGVAPPQVAPPGYTYQLVPKQPEVTLPPSASGTTPQVPLSPVPADTRPRLQDPPATQQQTLMRPQVQMRRVPPTASPSASELEKSPFDLPLDPPSEPGRGSSLQSDTTRPGNDSLDAYQGASAQSQLPAAVSPVRPRLQPIPFPQTLEGTTPVESAPQLIRPRSHTAANDSERYAAVPIAWPPLVDGSRPDATAARRISVGVLQTADRDIAPAQHQVSIGAQVVDRGDLDDGGWTASGR